MCLDLYPRDSMPRSSRLRNQKILTKFLWQSWFEICRLISWVWKLGFASDGLKMLEASMASSAWGRVRDEQRCMDRYMQSSRWAKVRSEWDIREDRGGNSLAQRGRQRRCSSDCGWSSLSLSRWCVGWSWGELWVVFKPCVWGVTKSENHLKVKWELKWFYGLARIFYSQTEFYFQFDYIFKWCQTQTRV